VPSISHEALVALFRNRPELALELLRQSLHVKLPDYAEIRIEDSDLTQLRPTVFTADLVVLLRNGDPVLVIVVEVQLSEDPNKLFSWPVYLATARARYRCPAFLLVIAPTEAVASWASMPIEIGGSFRGAPYVIGPALVPVVAEPAEAVRDPELAVLSALAHGNEPAIGPSVVLAALAAAAGLDDERAALYHDVILATLGEAARTALEKLMSSGYQFQTDFAKKHQAVGRAEGEAKGEAKGKAEGKAEAILRVLEARCIPLTAEERARFLGSTDLGLLDRWLVRSVTASSAYEVFAD